MTTKMLINAVEPEEYRVAFIKDGMLDGFHIETSTAEQKKRNIYKGVVERIDKRLQACFVNFGSDKNGFLPAEEIHPEYYQRESSGPDDQGAPPIGKTVKKGQELLVQVTKEMPGRKGPHLTTYLSLAGRYLVLTPGRTINGISRKIEDEKERQRLKSIMGRLRLPEEIGYIVRTVAAGQSKKELSRDLNRLLRMWKDIKKRVKESPTFSLIHKEQDICLRTLRDYYNSDVSEILVDDKETFTKIKDYMKIISPRYQRRVKFHKNKRPIFDQYHIEKEIESIYSNQVHLKSGGSIVIDSTEALICIDVNSGRGMVGKDIESMAFKTNLEAAKEIARQLRLRDMGGLVVIDFIDMRERKHTREVEKVLREELRKDRAKTDTSHISKFGLLELSRERLSPSIESRSYQTCHYCQGRGTIMSVESAAVSLLRHIWMGVWKGGVTEVNGTLPLAVAAYLQNRKRKELAELEERYGVAIVLRGDPSLPPGGGKLDFVKGDAVPAQ
jgi:ribonuclease E